MEEMNVRHTDVSKYIKKSTKTHEHWTKFRLRALFNYDSFQAAINGDKLAVDVSDTAFANLANEIVNERLHDLFRFLCEKKYDVVARDTHVDYPVWSEYQLGIQYTIDDEKKYEYGRLCLIPVSNLQVTTIHLHSKTCGGCKEKEASPLGPGSTSAAERFKKCARCRQVYYCSVECQKKHWKTHKKHCKTIE